jgi:hypothetical protein
MRTDNADIAAARTDIRTLPSYRVFAFAGSKISIA